MGGAFVGRLSLGILAMIGAIALAGPARAQSPEERADAYLKNELEPDIVAAIFDLPEQNRTDASNKLKLWREELRTTIIEFEKSPVTREAVVECLKEFTPYKEEWGQRFLQETAPVAQLPAKDQFDAIVAAYVRFIDTVNQSQGMRRPVHPPVKTIKYRLKRCAAESADKKMIWLYGEGQPIKFTRTPYWSYGDY
jgi:hypothetical protein